MSNIVIKVENISKMYRLGLIGYGSLKDDLRSAWARFRGKEDPNTEIGKDSRLGQHGEFWALRDLNFEINAGERIGIIGRNGAGKSTLLKILSKITAPTEGTIKVKGKIASLLEVGTGFHPELTGRENIFLNGAILGMRRREILKKFDEIVEFSGVSDFIDTPVKRYSSGMYVRLAFSVAAHLDSDILIVDEVLAVGDAEFQKKCIGKMEDVSKGQGRTILYVSHNLISVVNLCPTGLLLSGGQKIGQGNIRQIIQQYLDIKKGQDGRALWNTIDAPGNDIVKLREVWVNQEENGRSSSEVDISKDIQINYRYEVCKGGVKLYSCLHLRDDYGTYVFATTNHSSVTLGRDPLGGEVHDTGMYHSVCTIPANFLNSGSYAITPIIGQNISETILCCENVLSINVNDTGVMRKEFTGTWIGIVRPKMKWFSKKIG